MMRRAVRIGTGNARSSRLDCRDAADARDPLVEMSGARPSRRCAPAVPIARYSRLRVPDGACMRGQTASRLKQGCDEQVSKPAFVLVGGSRGCVGLDDV
jgi:hypothetical protein